MKICTILILVCFCLVNAQTQYNQTFQWEKPSFGVYAAEFGGATLGTALSVGTGVGLLYFVVMSSEFGENYVPQIIALVAVAPIALAPASAAFGACLVGERMNQNGDFWKSTLGAVCGSIVGYGLGYGITRINPERISGIIEIPTTLVGNSVGAVIGYNLSQNSGGVGLNNQRFGLPSIGLRLEKNNQGKIISALDLKLINARF